MDGFGQRLVEAREKKGYNQKQFAELLDITPTRLNYWEKDKREPDFFMFSKIVELLDADANQLLGLNFNNNSATDFETAYENLNEPGQKKVLDYINDLTENPKYLKNAEQQKISDDIASDLNGIRMGTKQE